MSAAHNPPTAPRGGAGAGAARRARVGRLRRRAVAWTVIAFVALWGAVYVQMRSGADPALGAGTKAAVVTKAATTSGAAASSGTSAGTTSSQDDATGGTSASRTGSSQDGAAASSPAPVTTSQS
jgi:hypothetical protein